MRRARLFLFAAAAGAACDGGQRDGDVGYDQASDPRIAALLAEECARTDFYDRPVSDVVPILVEKLERSATDPLKRAKEELAELGSEAIPELRRFVERHYADRLASPPLGNALDVLQRNHASEARDIVLRCLQHPSDTVRHGAILALKLGHAAPEDFDLLIAHMPTEIPERRIEVALALHAADPGRAEDLYLDWMEKGEYPGIWPYVAPLLAASQRLETARRTRELFPAVPEDVRAYVAAPAARAGDEQALEYLERTLAEHGEADRARRRTVLSAAGLGGLAPLLARALRTDPAPSVRAVAATGLRGLEATWSEEALEALRYGLDDTAADVRRACLGALVARADPAAVDRALALLDGSDASMQEGMAAILPRLAEDEDLAARVFAQLEARNAVESFLPPARRTAVLKSIGQVPGREPARLLRETAREHEGDEISGLRVHEWLTIQAANTGDEGRGYLLEELSGEADPRRRLDLLWAASAARTPATRERLLALLEREELTPWELYFVADRLVRIGPAREIAPRLKRLAPRVEDPAVRVALLCLLWRWY